MAKKWKSITPEQRLGCGNLQLTIAYTGDSLTPESLARLDATAGRNGSCVRAQTDIFAKIITIAIADLGKEERLSQIIRTMKGTGCPQIEEFPGDSKRDKLACADGFARIMEKHLATTEGTEGAGKEAPLDSNESKPPR